MHNAPGNPSYGGYEYQILTTIWVALELIFSKQLTDEIFIEPDSCEDIEVNLDVDADNASASLKMTFSQIDLMIQIKSRSTGPWSSSEIASILLGSPSKDKATRGPEKRRRPIEILESDPKKHYIFVTNAAVEKGLMPYNVDTLLKWPDVKDLPPYCRKGRTSEDREKIATRLALCSSITEEILNSRIGNLLSVRGHVPMQNHYDCLKALKEQVRVRLIGHAGGHWVKKDIVTALMKAGGSVLPNRSMDFYVPPSSYSKIVEAFKSNHVVLIAGPSGTGKTLTADILEHELKCSAHPFDVVYGNKGPAEIRERIGSIGPVLFHLRDPWGSNRLSPEADRWSNELPKLLAYASVDKKFLITSRSDILSSAGHELSRQLRQYCVSIEIEHYDAKARLKIYENLCFDLVGPFRRAVLECSEQVLKILRRPLEIERFIAGIKSEGDVPRNLDKLISNSQIDAISSVVANQVGENTDRVISAAIIWGLLSARPEIEYSMMSDIRRKITHFDSNFRPGIEEFVKFLIEGRNLRLENNILSFFHPKVADGLRLAIEKRPSDTEHALGLMCDALASINDQANNWGIETALDVLKATTKLKGIKPLLSSSTESILDDYLLQRVRKSNSIYFERIFIDLASWGSQANIHSEIARYLLGPLKSRWGTLRYWTNPELAPTVIEKFKECPSLSELIHRFICDVLPFSDTSYDSEIVGFVRKLSTNTEVSFLQALNNVSRGPSHAMNVACLIEGALAGTDPSYAQVLEIFFGFLDETNDWWDKFQDEYRRAEEYEVDAQYADHIFEEPGDRFHVAEMGLDTVVKIRREREGVNWIVNHPRKNALIKSWVRIIKDAKNPIEPTELSEIIAFVDDDWTRGRVWEIASKNWNESLTERLYEDLVRNNISEETLYKGMISALAASTTDDLWIDNLIGLSEKLTSERSLELVFDLAITDLDDDSNKKESLLRARKFASGLNGSGKVVGLALVDAIEEKPLSDIGKSLTHAEASFLADILPKTSSRLAAPLICICAVVGSIDILPTAQRLLALDDSQVGCNALLALRIAGTSHSMEEIRNALTHSRCKVRREAMRFLIDDIPPSDRGFLVEMFEDRSAYVRLGFVKLMQSNPWPEATDALISLLSDTRDYNSSNVGYLNQFSWPHHVIAREAAKAIKCYSILHEGHISEMIEMVTHGSFEDPFVTCSIFDALSKQNDGRVDTLLAKSLSLPGLSGSATYNPVSQAAAWALFDRSVNDKLTLDEEISEFIYNAILETSELVAGPLLMVVGLSEDEELLRTTAIALSGYSDISYIELLYLSVSFTDSNVDGELAQLSNNSRQPLVRIIEILRAQTGDFKKIALMLQEDEGVMDWCQKLDPNRGVEGVIAWMLNSQFALPIIENYDPRTFKLPDQIPLMTMRSLTPFLEEEDGNNINRI